MVSFNRQKTLDEKTKRKQCSFPDSVTALKGSKTWTTKLTVLRLASELNADAAINDAGPVTNDDARGYDWRYKD